MNKDRRRTLTKLHSDVQNLLNDIFNKGEEKPTAEEVQAWRGRADDIKSEVESVKDEEESALENMPESSPNRETAEAATEAMNNALSAFDDFETATETAEDVELDEARDALESAASYIDDATA